MALRSLSLREVDEEDREYEAYLSHKAKADVFKRRPPLSDAFPAVKDTRKCDYDLTPVASRRKRALPLFQPTASDDDLEPWNQEDDGPWREDLKQHKHKLLRAIWHDQRDPAMAMLLHMQQISISNPELVSCINAAMDDLGNALYESLQAVFLRSSENGLFSAAATQTRLRTTFKLELRNQLTVDSVRQKVLWALLEEKAGVSRTESVVVPGFMTLGRFKLESMAAILDAKQIQESPRMRHQSQQVLLEQVNTFVATTGVLTKGTVLHHHTVAQAFAAGFAADEASDRLRHILCVLCHVSCLKAIPMHFKAEMAQAATPLIKHKGNIVVSTDVTATSLYLLVAGTLNVHVESGKLVQKEPHDYFACGEVDLLTSNPGPLRVAVASETCQLAVLDKVDFEAILEKAFAASPAAKNLPPTTSPMTRRPKTAGPSNHTPVVAASRRVSCYDDQVRAHQRASREHTQAFLDRRRAVQAAEQAAKAAEEAAHFVETPPAPKAFTAKTKAQIHLLARLKMSMTPQMLRPKADDVATTELPAFEFFPRFTDSFDVRHVELLYMGPQQFDMDEMTLVECGPPLPETPSLVLPPKVQIDASVLLMDYLAVLATRLQVKTARGGPGTSVWGNSTWVEPVLPTQPDATFAQFTEMRKKVSAPVVKGQKTPFAALAMYCCNWKADAPTEAATTQLFGMDLDPGAAAASSEDSDAYDDVTTAVFAPAVASAVTAMLTTTSSTSTALSITSEAADPGRGSLKLTDDPKEPPPIAPKRGSAVAGRRGSLASVHEELDDDDVQATDSASQNPVDPVDFKTDFGSFALDVAPSVAVVEARESTNLPKHLFRISSQHQASMGSLRTLPLSDAKSLARKEAYDRLAAQTSGTAATPRHLKASQRHLEAPQQLPESLWRELELVNGSEDRPVTETTKLCPLRIRLQNRMEAVLNALQLSAKCKLDIVMKYTDSVFAPQLEAALELWERVVVSIADRELTLQKIHEFELVASDPRRHFQTISTARLKEERQRDRLMLVFQAHSKYCQTAISQLKDKYGDVVMYQDRSYADKMAHDYTELLFELECERVRLYYGGVQPDVIDDEESHPAEVRHASALARAVKERGDNELAALRSKIDEAREAREAAVASARQQAMTKRLAAKTPRPPSRPKERNIQEVLGSALQRLRPTKPLVAAPSLNVPSSESHTANQL
ncbi:hypothetical protein ACHHYP_06343 [Achlya hypogyna]|uniref:Cyclic nucleotide-binding domain-containing protein n=1 Tax=Achlya hypogyna TaxID=1202772 RepID=A0A1V9YU76_ACHHY|nr:hypothetical protein ACHHYP_06343 [Achlya hypogyna]